MKKKYIPRKYIKTANLNINISFSRWIQANVSAGELSKNIQSLLADNEGKDVKLVYSNYNWNPNDIALAKI